jgi:hypothetical protein
MRTDNLSSAIRPLAIVVAAVLVAGALAPIAHMAAQVMG